MRTQCRKKKRKSKKWKNVAFASKGETTRYLGLGGNYFSNQVKLGRIFFFLIKKYIWNLFCVFTLVIFVKLSIHICRSLSFQKSQKFQ